MSTQIPHFIDGSAPQASPGRTADVLNPSTGEVQAQVPLASVAEVDTAVAVAVEAQRDGPPGTPSAAPAS